jgi:RCC1 and BTB domain-containing protein
LSKINRGQGLDGRLGHNNVKKELTPKKVNALANEVIVEVTCGCYHTCAVTSTGSIYTWGGTMSTGHEYIEGGILYPRPLQDLTFNGIIGVNAQDTITMCVTKAGEVYTWGNGWNGKLGHGYERYYQKTPKRIEALIGMGVKQVACGFCPTTVFTEDGLVYTFGNGKYGQLGHGDREQKTSPMLEHRPS